MRIEMDSIREREEALTVVRGCVATVLDSWERLDEATKKDLLTSAMGGVKRLVKVLEDDVASLRIAEEADDSDAGSEPRATIASL